jgi:hypothetical protein
MGRGKHLEAQMIEALKQVEGWQTKKKNEPRPKR